MTPGKIVRCYEACCAKCEDWVRTDSRHKGAMRRWLRKKGWSETKELGWLCRACAEQRTIKRHR